MFTVILAFIDVSHPEANFTILYGGTVLIDISMLEALSKFKRK